MRIEWQENSIFIYSFERGCSSNPLQRWGPKREAHVRRETLHRTSEGKEIQSPKQKESVLFSLSRSICFFALFPSFCCVEEEEKGKGFLFFGFRLLDFFDFFFFSVSNYLSFKSTSTFASLHSTVAPQRLSKANQI